MKIAVWYTLIEVLVSWNISRASSTASEIVTAMKSRFSRTVFLVVRNASCDVK